MRNKRAKRKAAKKKKSNRIKTRKELSEGRRNSRYYRCPYCGASSTGGFCGAISCANNSNKDQREEAERQVREAADRWENMDLIDRNLERHRRKMQREDS